MAQPSRVIQASALAQVSKKDQEGCQKNSQLCLSQGSEDQRSFETHKHCTACSISKLSSASAIVHRVLFIPFKHHVSSMGLASACVSVSADITLPISPSPQKQQEATTHHQKVFVLFLSMEARQMQPNYATKGRPIHVCC